MMVETTTPKSVNLRQLSGELGGVWLAARSGGASTTVQTDACSQGALDAAVASHVAVDERVNEQTLRDRAAAALQSNRDFLAITNPTNAQTVAQVKALTRQVSGIIRLINNQLDGTD